MAHATGNPAARQMCSGAGPKKPMRRAAGVIGDRGATVGVTEVDTQKMSAVSIFEVEDIDSASWTAEVAVVVQTRQEAYKRLRDAGLHKN